MANAEAEVPNPPKKRITSKAILRMDCRTTGNSHLPLCNLWTKQVDEMPETQVQDEVQMVKPRPCTKYRPCAKPLTELVNDSDSDGFELEDDFQEDEVIAPGSSNSAPETVIPEVPQRLRARKRPRVQPSDIDLGSQLTQQSRASAAGRLVGRDHFPYKIPSAKNEKRASQRRCRVCAEKPKTGKNTVQYTTIYCKKCNVGLCLGECFEAFHTKQKYWE
ncbi:hypothetical protein C0J52_20300 [Blattella germanica]|nr:hypothetical protein C0J52_20300 [Blattella germanica]